MVLSALVKYLCILNYNKCKVEYIELRVSCVFSLHSLRIHHLFSLFLRISEEHSLYFCSFLFCKFFYLPSSFMIVINVSHLFHHITVPPRQNPAIIQQPQVNVDSIFYVHPSEGPNSVTVTPLLTRSNYLAWSRSMQRALGAKNKLSFIDGSIHVPAIDDLNRGAWERCNHLIHSWILNSVSPQIA